MRLLRYNLLRKPLRTSLTVFGVAVALFLCCFLETVLEGFNAGVNMSDASRLVVMHKESIMFELPMSYRSIISQIEGVRGVTWASWFGALSQEPAPDGKKREEFFAQFATDIESYLPLYPEIKVPPEQLRDLLSDRKGCLLGTKIAERLNKKVGDRLVIRSTIWTQKDGSPIWEFNVRAIYTSDSPTFDQTMMLFSQKRFDEARLFGQGSVGLYLLGISDPNRSAEIAAVIDSRFANSPFETRSMTEKAFNLQFVGMMGNFQLLLRSVGSAVVLTMLLVSANTMMMSARERTREMGILKAIGFSDGHVFMLLIGESLAISLLGALLGVGLAWVMTNALHINPKPEFFPVFYLPLHSMLLAVGLAAATGFLSGIVPAVAGMRLKATEALRERVTMAIPFAYSLRNIAVRKGSSAMAVGGIALVVLVFVTLLSLAAGFRRVVESSGSPQNVIVVRKGADAELQSQVMLETARIISELPIVAQAQGRKLVVSESVVIVSRPKRSGGETNVTIRGVLPHSPAVHCDVRLAEGRWLTPGSNEAVIGVALDRRLRDVGIGQTMTIGRNTWHIVGLFEAGGSALESELWMDGDLLQSSFHRGGIFQSVLFRAATSAEEAVRRLNALIDSDPRLRTVQTMTEVEYYRKQAKLMSDVITILGGILTAIMSIGAIVGATNTMYAAVSQRKREIGCLLAMGFTPAAIWVAFMLESLLLAGLGAVLGCSVSLLFNGMKTGTTNWATFSETAFQFLVTPQILVTATCFSLLMGFIGGVMPACRAAWMTVVDALRRA